MTSLPAFRRSRALIALLTAFALRAAPAADSINFNRDIRRILSDNCFKCHGPDEKERKGGKKGARLRLDTPEGAQMDLGGRQAIAPGHPEKSELIKRLTSTDPDEKMPPADSGKKVGAAEIALLQSWIKEGAKYSKHWSYIKPVRPALPKVANRAWPKNDIDFFIVARLESEKLKPSPEADRAALIRRVSLDLTGLPPTPEEVQEFVKDRSKNAYERVVDRLLRNPNFGEHWARWWLDQARYADSAGYADDPARTIWAYRDYVIRAFNSNKPFDQFTLEQLAGDLLTDATEEQEVATAFHRNTMTNNEGGTSDEEFRNVAVIDRVNTTMSVWMGTTMGCAQCHTHKYDPITNEEYFRMFAILNNTADADRSDETPVHTIWTKEQKAQRAKLEGDMAGLEKIVTTATPELMAAQVEWEKTFATEVDWKAAALSNIKSKEGATVTRADHDIVHVDKKGKTDIYTIELASTPKGITAIRIETLPDDSLSQKGPGHADGNFVISRVTATNGTNAITFKAAYADFEQENFNAVNVLDKKNDTGWAIAPQFGKPHWLVLVPEKPIDIAEKLTLTIEQLSNTEFATLGNFRITLSDDTRAPDFAKTPSNVLESLKKTSRNDADAATITKHYLTVAPALKNEREQLAGLKKNYADMKPVTTVPVLHELAADKRRTTKMQIRGNYLALGKEVSEGLPAAFGASPEGPMNRLTLAKWLVSPDNPLTARVVANRLWESIFGIGIVRTSEDFGLQGEAPSHPELLDWLATEFTAEHWDVKHMLKLMVMSAAYRQNSRVTPDILARDPDNRLLARGPRFRLSAETIRDQALCVSGLLSDKMFGPPVKPPQPKMGLSAAFGSATDWETSSGEDRFRRAIYTTWRRSNPYPSMATFDAPNREVCTVRRDRSNTPLQALVTMNDPVYVEAAQALARRMSASGKTDEERLRRGFELCVAREPAKTESAKLLELYHRARLRYDYDPAGAMSVATKPIGALPKDSDRAEIAAWTVVANVLLNLDETLMKR